MISVPAEICQLLKW